MRYFIVLLTNFTTFRAVFMPSIAFSNKPLGYFTYVKMMFNSSYYQPIIVGIANGYPMGAVVTTKEIASVLSRALHFNTFGGNPVACTVASSVIDVIKEDKLQEVSFYIIFYSINNSIYNSSGK